MVRRTPFTNCKDVLIIARRAFAKVSKRKVRNCIAHVAKQENHYRRLHGMEPLPAIYTETVDESDDESSDSVLAQQEPTEGVHFLEELIEAVESADMQSDSELIEQDENDRALEIQSDSLIAQQVPIGGLVDEPVQQVPIGGLVVNEPAQQDPIEGNLVYEVAVDLPTDFGIPLQEPIGGNLVFDEEGKIVGPIMEADMEHIEAPVEPYQACTLCDFKTQSFSKLSLHLKSHYQCDLCGKDFHGINSKRNLERHSRKYKKPKKYDCWICRKSFPLQSGLKRHLKSCESPDKGKSETFNCLKCEKAFQFQSRLNRHMQFGHSSEKKNDGEYVCLECGRVYSYESHLTRHMKSGSCPEAKKDAIHNCLKCEKVFPIKSQLIRHVKSGSCPEPKKVAIYNCTQCDKSFSFKS